MSIAAHQEKAKLVQVIADKFSASKSTIATDYRGLTVAELTELRKQLREAGIEYRVLKNTMSRRALQQLGIDGFDEYLTGPTALAFGLEDPVAPAKILNDFARRHKALELKGGIVEGRVVNGGEVAALAALPSREGLLSMLLSVLQAPMRNLAYAVKQISEQQPNEG